MPNTGDACEILCIHEDIVQEIRTKLINDQVAQKLAETFKALGDPTRVKLIHALVHHELCVCDISTLLNMSQSAISHQLRVLRNLKLVKYRKEGKVVYYSLDDLHILELFNQGYEHVTENHQS